VSVPAPYRSTLVPGRDGFASLVRAEWTKFRTVRGWAIGMAAVVVLVVFVSWQGSTTSGGGGGGPMPTGPDGSAVADRFAFVERSLEGDGTITARVTSLTGSLWQGPDQATEDGTVPWAKAGVIVKDGTDAGSTYAAIMVTPGHGVRMQHDFTHDVAGRPGAVSEGSPRWLRLTRDGDTVTGSESTDGERWTEVGTARLAGLPSTVSVGLFVTSPEYLNVEQPLGGVMAEGGPSQANATFDQVDLEGRSPDESWTGEAVGGTGLGGGTGDLEPTTEVFDEDDGTFTLSGSGDIAPAVGGPGPNTIERTLGGAFVGLVVVVVIAAMFMTAEYRRGLIRTTLVAAPGRGRVLAAKAVVIGGVTFVAGLVGVVAAVVVGGGTSSDDLLPVSGLTEVRVVVGTAALLAVAAVLALAVGTILQRSAGAVATSIVLIVLPYLLAVASVLPNGPAGWLLRVSPAAAFAVQQSVPERAQVDGVYLPATGYYPLAPWAGFAVLCAWTAVALAVATALLRRRDA
jgi:ABC-type transport system involved in multi-copper enzyme maturation permease subunit/regulation of enolase protein 1 (concanavalin A-like superfamily)